MLWHITKEESSESVSAAPITPETDTKNEKLFLTSILQNALNVKGGSGWDYQKKKSAETLPVQDAHGMTSETQVGQTSEDSIPHTGDESQGGNEGISASPTRTRERPTAGMSTRTLSIMIPTTLRRF